MEIDEAFKIVGEYGPLQRRVFWSMAIPQIFVAWLHILNAFVAAEPNFECIASGGKVYSDCKSADENQCHEFVFTKSNFTSIVSEWSLVCGNAYKSDLVQSVVMFGLFIGNVGGGAIADQQGRRSVLIVNVIGTTVFSLMSASPVTAPNHAVYTLWRLLAGVCVGAYGLLSFTLPAELVSSSERGFINTVTTVAFAIGVASLSLLAYFVRDWRLLSIVTALPGLVGIYYYMVVPESPRWLLSQGRVMEAEQQLTYIATANKGRAPDKPIKLRRLVPRVSYGASASILDIVRHRSLRSRTLNNIYTWFVNAMVYYGLTLKAGDFGSNRYVSIAMVGLIEIPADIIALCLMDRIGRRATFSSSLMTAGLFSLAVLFFPSPGNENIVMSLALLGKLGISTSYCVCWMHAVEMYPTNIRNKALSVCTVGSRIGGMLFPFVLTLGRLYSGVDFMIFGVSAIVAGLVSLKLPETLNRPLVETVDEIDSVHG